MARARARARDHRRSRRERRRRARRTALRAEPAGETAGLGDRRRRSRPTFPRKRGRSSSRRRTRWCPPENDGGFAAHKLIDAVQAAVELPFAFGHRTRGAALRRARAFRAVAGAAPPFLRRTRASKIAVGRRAEAARRWRRAGVVGAGTMGSGIAIAFAQGRHSGRRRRQQRRSRRQGAPDRHGHVHVSGAEGAADARGGVAARRNRSPSPRIGTSSADCRRRRRSGLRESRRQARSLSQARRDRQARRHCSRPIRRRSTSTRWPPRRSGPRRVFGLHFFVPANIMPLLEIVRGKQTSAAERLRRPLRSARGCARRRCSRATPSASSETA